MPLPRFVQRLFQNDGYGPKLRHDIIPWDEEKSLVALEAWRQAMIGTPMPMAGTTLPSGFMWADGSFASFASYPELKVKYDAGGFAGMLLAYNASEQDIAAYPGKFKPDAANPTGLFVPRLNGLFARYCLQTGVGTFGPDTGRNVVGSWSSGVHGTGHVSCDGAVGRKSAQQPSVIGGDVPGATFFIDTSLSWGKVHTGSEFVPTHYRQPVALYLGRAAHV